MENRTDLCKAVFNGYWNITINRVMQVKYTYKLYSIEILSLIHMQSSKSN